MSSAKLRGVVVGCRGIGKSHIAGILASEQVELFGLCDVDEAIAREHAEANGEPRVFTDFDQMLTEANPDVVALGVPTALHASMAIRAAEAGVRGIIGEKPMAANLAEGRAMIEACERHGATLVINHQRRTRPDLIEMRRLAESGAIGEVQAIRASCGGDLLTDGTHAIDSLRFLGGDRDVAWLLGQVHHAPIIEGQKLGKGVSVRDGHRYRHGVPVDSGAIAAWQFTDGPRAELFTGDCRIPAPYQDYQILGNEGRLWRPGDKGEHTLFLQNADTGGRREPVEVENPDYAATFASNYDRLAGVIREGGRHPLAADLGLRVLEIIMAIYESARLSRRIEFPLAQDRYPMELMVESGRFA